MPVVTFVPIEVLRNATFMLLSALARLAGGVLVFVLLARLWGAEDFGRFMYPFALVSLAVMVVDYGFGLQVVRDVSRDRSTVPQVIARGLTAKLFLSLLLAVGLAIYLSAQRDGASTALVTGVLALGAVINSFALFFSLFFRAIERFDRETATATVANVSLLVAVAAALLLGAGLVGVALAFLVARLVHLAAALREYRALFGCRAGFGSPAGAARLLRDGLPFGIHVLVGTLYFQLDTLFVEHFAGAEGVGSYQAAIRLLMALLIVPEVLSNVYLPVFARGDGRGRLIAAADMTRQLAATGAAGFAVLVLGGAEITRLIYGAGYERASALVPWFGVVLLVRFVGASYGLLLTVARRQLVRTFAVSAAVLVSLVSNWLLIPRHGLAGAAWAAIITNVVLAGVYVAFVRADHGEVLVGRQTAGTAVVVAATAAAWWLGVGGVLPAVAMALAALATGVTSAEWVRVFHGARRVARAA